MITVSHPQSCLPLIYSRAMWINLPGLSLLATICALCGAVVYAEYRHCDPLTDPRSPIIAKDQVRDTGMRMFIIA